MLKYGTKQITGNKNCLLYQFYPNRYQKYMYNLYIIWLTSLNCEITFTNSDSSKLVFCTNDFQTEIQIIWSCNTLVFFLSPKFGYVVFEWQTNRHILFLHHPPLPRSTAGLKTHNTLEFLKCHLNLIIIDANLVSSNYGDVLSSVHNTRSAACSHHMQ